jgi:hypothetical protein
MCDLSLDTLDISGTGKKLTILLIDGPEHLDYGGLK